MLPSKVRLAEVGPRDGLQNESVRLPIAARVSFVNSLIDTGLSYVECGSFVSPQRVPQMASTAELFAQLERKRGITYSALVPNLKGLTAAVDAGVGEIALFVSASEPFSQANINCSIGESLRRAQDVARAAKEHRLPVRAYISCVLGCPYQGTVSVEEVVRVAEVLQAMGCYEISLGDTIGVGTPPGVKRLLDALAARFTPASLAVHFHDTWGQALVNIYAALQYGIATIDASVAGLGGCPYAPGASGNVATEDVVYLLDGLGIETGVDLAALAVVGRSISQALGHPSRSRAGAALAPALSSLRS